MSVELCMTKYFLFIHDLEQLYNYEPQILQTQNCFENIKLHVLCSGQSAKEMKYIFIKSCGKNNMLLF